MQRLIRILLILLLPMVWSAMAVAVQPDEMLQDKKLEERARDLSAGLRCLVCQNQSIDDSDAPLARDLRILVRERLKAGDSDPQIRQFLLARYGEYIFLKPPFNFSTLLLWLLPLFILLAAGIFLVFRSRSRRSAATVPLTDGELRKLREISGDEGK